MCTRNRNGTGVIKWVMVVMIMRVCGYIFRGTGIYKGKNYWEGQTVTNNRFRILGI